MKVFYWTEAYADTGKRFYQIDTGGGFIAEVPNYSISPDMLKAMLNDGFVEISSDTAYKLGFPT